MFHLKASPRPTEEAASVLYHTKHIGALIKRCVVSGIIL